MTEKPLHSIEFVKAVKDQDRVVIEEFSSRLIPRIIEYLMITLKANKFLAEECSHHAFSVLLDRINAGELNEKSSVVSYAITTARNEYFRMIKSEIREETAILQEQYYVDAEEQIQLLVDQDRERALNHCVQQLDLKSRDFINYILQHPDYSMLKVGKVFDISPEAARTRKSRILAILSDCVAKKMGK